MMNEYHPDAALLEEIKELRRELAEANSIINAIKHGEVDALLISNESSDQVYVLKGADHIYRVLVEEMQEGCATIASNGVILFCNKNFADIVKFTGSSDHPSIISSNRRTWASLPRFYRPAKEVLRQNTASRQVMAIALLLSCRQSA